MKVKDFLKMIRIEKNIEAYWLDKSRISMYIRDYWPKLVYGLVHGEKAPQPAGLIIPKNEDEVQEVLSLANKYGIRVRVYGGGSGVLGAASPSGNDVIVDITRLNWIRWYDRKSRIVDVGAGAYMAEVEEWLNKQGYTTRHYPQSIAVATVGGLLSTYSSGQYSTGYGNIEDIVLGLNFVTPSAGLVRIRPSPRGGVIPLLKSLMLGSEGTLGVITRVYLGVFRRPRRVYRFAYLAKDFYEAIDSTYRVIEAGIYPQLLRIFDEYETMVTLGIKKWGSGIIGVLEGGMASRQNLRYLNRVYKEPLDESYFDKWYRGRNDVIKYIYTLYKSGLAVETIELAAPWSKVKDLYSDVRSRVLEIDGVITATAHIGHFYNNGVGIYFTFSIDLGRFSEVYPVLWDTVEYIALRNNCSPLHHHGVGRVRGKYLTQYIGYEASNVIRLIKNALDPNNILAGGLSELVE